MIADGRSKMSEVRCKKEDGRGLNIPVSLLTYNLLTSDIKIIDVRGKM